MRWAGIVVRRGGATRNSPLDRQVRRGRDREMAPLSIVGGAKSGGRFRVDLPNRFRTAGNLNGFWWIPVDFPFPERNRFEPAFFEKESDYVT